jgi:hypothetical protein
MKEFLNKWLWLDLLFYKDEFQEINKLKFIHPVDRDLFKNSPTNSLYECIGIDGDYLIIKNRNHQYRVMKEAIKQIMPTPKFKWGDKVVLISKPGLEAIVDDLFWHHKGEKYYFNLLMGGKKKSNRYSENELTIINMQ